MNSCRPYVEAINKYKGGCWFYRKLLLAIYGGGTANMKKNFQIERNPSQYFANENNLCEVFRV